jgi:transcriptional regulator with AAA-type ATPase domain
VAELCRSSGDSNRGRRTCITGRRGVDIQVPPLRERREDIPELAASDSMCAWASRYARLVFERCGRNKRQARGLLNISYHTLDAYLRYGKTGSRPANRRVPAWARAEPCEPAV